MSLPTKEKYEDLKEKRKQEQEKRLEQERLVSFCNVASQLLAHVKSSQHFRPPAQQAAQETLKRRQEMERRRAPASANGELPQARRAPQMTKAGGWLPSADSGGPRGELDDPLLQQIENIQSFLRQARQAKRADEVAMLEENLRQLQDEYDQQQTSLAIALSQRLAEEESLQQGELQRLEAREKEGREHWATTATGAIPTSASWERSLDICPAGGDQREEDTEAVTPTAGSPTSARAEPTLVSHDESPPRLRSLGGHVTPPGGDRENCSSLNPFDEDDDATPVEEDPSNPFFEDIQREHKVLSNGKKEYNPFEEEDVEEQVEAQGNEVETAPGNPFEGDDDDYSDAANPFSEAPGGPASVSTNPFDGDDDDEVLPDVDMIEEELLLQQIDNIRAYIFDAKLSGRLDEVELLSENLKELQRTLQEQKKNKH